MRYGIAVIIIIGIGAFVFTQNSEEITVERAAERESVALSDRSEDDSEDTIRENGGYTAVSETVSGVSFSFTMRDSWSTTRTPNGTLILHDQESEDPVNEAQIAIETFTANGFQVSETLSVFSRIEHEVAGKRAVTYVVSPNDEARTEVAWRGDSHKLTQVRLRDENPSVFFVFIKNPSLSEAEFTRFLNALSL